MKKKKEQLISDESINRGEVVVDGRRLVKPPATCFSENTILHSCIFIHLSHSSVFFPSFHNIMNALLRLLSCFLPLSLCLHSSFANTFHLPMIHRYSDEFKSILQQRNQYLPTDWPQEGSRDYHERLIAHDRQRHAGRRLTSSNGSYYLASSNETVEVDTLGGLHYSFITIGTPNLTFLVALDTGSDLFWVPCDCHQCAPTSVSYYSLGTGDFSIYSTSTSKTGKTILCSDKLCSSTILSSNCTSSESCNYNVVYASVNTATSGVIVQDVLYLDSENQGGVSTPIYFGCGKVQTGDLANGSVAPNGLLGLGPDDISVPSTLARSGVIPNSFSMCFSDVDKSGRLVFGNKGNATLPNTPLLSVNPNAYYVLQAENASVEGKTLMLSQNLIFDTGTSYTLLPTATLQALGAIFNQKVKLTPTTGPFAYCWAVSDNKQLDNLPPLAISFSGGSTLMIQVPYISFADTTGNVSVVCLGVADGSSIGTGIIGHNFMGGYEFFFDKDSMTLSWSLSNCYHPNGTVENSAFSPPAAAPSIDKGVVSTSSPKQSTSSAMRKTNSFSFQFLFFIICISIFCCNNGILMH